MQEKPSGSDDEDKYRRISSKNEVDLIENGGKVEKIGDSTPVQDFESMMSRRDSPEWVNRAITEMKNKIHDLVEDSYEGDNYPKALDLLVALRKGCILEQVLTLSLSPVVVYHATVFPFSSFCFDFEENKEN